MSQHQFLSEGEDNVYYSLISSPKCPLETTNGLRLPTAFGARTRHPIVALRYDARRQLPQLSAPFPSRSPSNPIEQLTSATGRTGVGVEIRYSAGLAPAKCLFQAQK